MSTAFDLSNTTDSEVKNVGVYGFDTAIKATNSTNTRITNITASQHPLSTWTEPGSLIGILGVIATIAGIVVGINRKQKGDLVKKNGSQRYVSVWFRA